ncbi:precorrin-2 dehydrogenase/sirohydrochlorin ferrochelatase family protein [Sphingomonas mucosissima]|uniref:precorrin-2 dehydrogenase/sirohydrochlorin ferrochelatase family protein n=1 Tax=Sphingomonas mucosissima TaxID=370959 RepID=UPI000B4AC91C|nr:NAD(P)-dependent oxidoreductase [Sphingomonas mucosissima]
MHSLPIFVRLRGRRVILVGDGEAADAKRRLLERAGAVVVREDGSAWPEAAGSSANEAQGDGSSGTESPLPPLLAIVVDDEAAVARLKAARVLVNAVDRPDLCDFTLPAIIDRDPVIVAVGTGGASAGLAAALRQRLETLLPTSLGRLADALFAARGAWRTRYPDSANRRRAIAAALAPGAVYDPLQPESTLGTPPEHDGPLDRSVVEMTLHSDDPDDLTLRQARLLANADRVCHSPDVPTAILNRARADADRAVCDTVPVDLPGLTIHVRMA